METVFSASRTKLKRARQFISELEAFTHAYIQRPIPAQLNFTTNPPTVDVDWDR